METKFHGIIIEEDKDIVVSSLSAIEIPMKQKINLIEVILNVMHMYDTYFATLSTNEKLKSMAVVTLIFDTLLDKDLNPLAAKYVMRGVYALNNNILDIEGGPCDVSH